MGCIFVFVDAFVCSSIGRCSPCSLEGIGDDCKATNSEAFIALPMKQTIHPHPIAEATLAVETSRPPGQLVRSASEDADPRRQATCRVSSGSARGRKVAHLKTSCFSGCADVHE